MHHVLSSEQFTPPVMELVCQQADGFSEALTDRKAKIQLMDTYKGYSMCNLFYEPSTRTRLSFGTAADNLGLSLQSTENAAEFSSAAKGETLEDTIKVLNEYGFDIIVLRHPETGSVARAAAVSQAAVINAGDGKGEHPSQAALDVFTIRRDHGRLDDLSIVIGGDLKHGRTARSLAKQLSQYPKNHLIFVSTPELQMDEDILDYIRSRGTTYEVTTDMIDAFRVADGVYWTRLQKERLETNATTIARARKMLQGRWGFMDKLMASVTKQPSGFVESGFVIDAAAMQALPEHGTVYHPLPKVGEIAPEVDDDPRARYFQQAGNGVPVRMALINMILTQPETSLTQQTAGSTEEIAR